MNGAPEDWREKIMYSISHYGVLHIEQLVRLALALGSFQEPTKRHEQKIRQWILGNHELFKTGGYVSAYPTEKPDERLIRAYWALLKFMEQIEHDAHFKSGFPAQIFFLKKNIGYEIAVIEPNEKHLLRLLDAPDKEEIRYVLVVRDIQEAARWKLPDNPCLFATVEYTSGQSEIPTVKFITTR